MFPPFFSSPWRSGRFLSGFQPSAMCFLFMIEVCSQDGPSVLSVVQGHDSGCSYCRVLAKYEVVNLDCVNGDNQVIAAWESRVFNTSFYDSGVLATRYLNLIHALTNNPFLSLYSKWRSDVILVTAGPVMLQCFTPAQTDIQTDRWRRGRVLPEWGSWS